jgi:hypothetical protein
MTCSCYACTEADVRDNPAPKSELLFGRVDARMARMFLCEKCGNKRCPHAADHNLPCTGSNASGQRGSLYEDAPVYPVDGTPGTNDQSREAIKNLTQGEGTP